MSTRVWSAIGLVGLSFGCGSPRMAAPADVIASSEELVISDRSSWSGAMADESFQLGAFAVTEVDRNWTSTSDVEMVGFTQGRTTGGFSFNTTGEGASHVGVCTTEVNDSSRELGGGVTFANERQSVGCFCRAGDDVTFLSVRAATTSQYEGEVRMGPTRYKITGVYERESGPNSGDPTGYRVDSDNGPIGAVDVVKPGRVWLSRTLAAEQRAPLACLFAGLLLYMPPSHNFD